MYPEQYTKANRDTVVCGLTVPEASGGLAPDEG